MFVVAILKCPLFDARAKAVIAEWQGVKSRHLT